MAKEFAIGIYLFCFKVLFSIFKIFPLRDKTTFVTSFGDNCQYIADEMDKQDIPIQKVFLMKPSSHIEVKDDGKTIVLPFESNNIIAMIQSIYHLATSKWLIIDNYFGFLSAIAFKKQVKCVQVWHAAGAVKQFGAKDPSIQNRSARARTRFLEVYKKFDYVTSGSERMAEIYQESFQLPTSHILRTGIPRTDFFFNDESKKTARSSLLAKYPELEHKKIILYAPTFRNDGLNNGEIALDLEMLYKELKDEQYALLLKLHPAVKTGDDLQHKFPGFVYPVKSEFHVNQLLISTDLLITDYSSIPFEFSFLERPMIFFAYDLEKYVKERGFWEDYASSMPGPVVSTTEELLGKIRVADQSLMKIAPFNQKWNQYSTGNSSRNLVDFLFK
ncbi:CDP-glycerol glycerophosphotransferase family protein [Peribacillus sp. CSMR9]|uniref:CDP-glycerol glycerophosphotransferase family protein n=1 Tax=Peribacillus sp. CSMR9 TaxID=2981350 RepID=UPI0029555084|nr:CDP-glycerol glycerophosphotransferase family protein [Peribacillus sp. CSMR9]MDV7763870.1 CDP-glycerol glycerophosphotransferase family protein [Peribacillus sp. CSMR9]